MSTRTSFTSGVHGSSLQQDARALAAALPPLLVDAERVASTVAQGLHGRRRAGPGDAFWQFRRYQPGDSITQIDWRKSARAAHLFIREREWEAANSVWLWADASASMQYRSATAPASKADRARLLMLALSMLLVAADERVAALDGAEPPSANRRTPERLALHFARTETGSSLPPPRALPRYAQLVLASDFLAPHDEIFACLRGFAAMGARAHLLEILDPAEEEFPFTGRVRFEGLETATRITFGRAESVRERYRAVLASHRGAVRDTARRLGFTVTAHRTDRPPHLTLLALYGALARQAAEAR